MVVAGVGGGQQQGRLGAEQLAEPDRAAVAAGFLEWGDHPLDAGVVAVGLEEGLPQQAGQEIHGVAIADEPLGVLAKGSALLLDLLLAAAGETGQLGGRGLLALLKLGMQGSTGFHQWIHPFLEDGQAVALSQGAAEGGFASATGAGESDAHGASVGDVL